MPEYTALSSLSAPGTLVYGYHRGDPVSEEVVAAWGLVVGADVVEGELPEDGGNGPGVRPGPEDTRATWEQYAVAAGMTADEAASASQEELEAIGTPAADPERPADSAKKADWVAYVKGRGADEAWADSADTTKADLIGWEPTVGDPVAVAATEAIQA